MKKVLDIYGHRARKKALDKARSDYANRCKREIRLKTKGKTAAQRMLGE